eukprot:3270585-Rhodomonas_salina.2
MSGTDIAYPERNGHHNLHTKRPEGAISLRACYGMSGTDLRYGRICIRASYAKSGTDIAYAPTKLVVYWQGMDLVRHVICLRAAYAMSGTNMLSDATCLSHRWY